MKVEYRGTLDDGTEFDSSEGREPLEFTVGSGQTIEGFDAAVNGMVVGETKTVTLEPDNAYGPYREDLVIEVPLENMPEGVTEGQQLMAPTGQTVTVVSIGETTATIDANHPLAGETLTFEIELVEIS